MILATAAKESCAEHTFPSTLSEFVTEQGDTELKLPNGAATLGDVLETMPEQTFETAEDARMTIYGALGEDAIGRKGYSDRDAVHPGEKGYEPVSL